MLEICNWYGGYQAPAVLMIDDLSDTYIDIYKESCKNDWGHLCEEEGSAYDFLKKNLLISYPEVKITFFVPYAKHNVVSEAIENYKKYALGDREAYSLFLQSIVRQGHEIAHHGSNHGEYINKNNPSTDNNFKHEWELFETVEEGTAVTKKGIELFEKYVNYDVVGGKFCGYLKKENSLEIIDNVKFEYWSVGININTKKYGYTLFGKNNVIDFPTNFNGNTFVKLGYKTGNSKKDKIKFFTNFLQPIYNIFQEQKLEKLYQRGNIISIQEHISPATSSGSVQSSNIVSDIKSLNKIYNILSSKSIWHATCREISRYIYGKENSKLYIDENDIIVEFDNYKKFDGIKLSLSQEYQFTLISEAHTFRSSKVGNHHVVSIPIFNGKNKYKLI